MKKVFNFWFLLRMVLTSLLLLWSFYELFTKGKDSGWRALLFIAAISAGANLMYYYFFVNKKQDKL
jgi:hypothetical protein